MFEKWTLDDTLQEEEKKLNRSDNFDNTEVYNSYSFSEVYDNSGYCSRFN